MGLRALYDSVRRIVAHALGMGSNRLELFSIECQEELERQAMHLAWMLAAFVFAGLALLLLSLLLLLIFWDNYRIPVALTLLIGYSVAALLCLWRLRWRLRHAPTPFAATVREFRRDQAAILRKSGDES